jgi:hypothetical protein
LQGRGPARAGPRPWGQVGQLPPGGRPRAYGDTRQGHPRKSPVRPPGAAGRPRPGGTRAAGPLFSGQPLATARARAIPIPGSGRAGPRRLVPQFIPLSRHPWRRPAFSAAVRPSRSALVPRPGGEFLNGFRRGNAPKFPRGHNCWHRGSRGVR